MCQEEAGILIYAVVLNLILGGKLKGIKKTPDRKLLPGVLIQMLGEFIPLDDKLCRWWVLLF